MTKADTSSVIVIADDSASDRKLAVMAFEKAGIPNPIQQVGDGEELMDFLRQAGRYAGRPPAGTPLLILLDINMPRKDGLEALREIKQDSALRGIPVIMLTTSKADEDIVRSYDLGVNAFVTKPVHFDEFLDAIGKLGDFWLKLAKLPKGGKRAATAESRGK